MSNLHLYRELVMNLILNVMESVMDLLLVANMPVDVIAVSACAML